MKIIVIKTPKVEYTCEIKIKQAGRYGRYYLYVNNEMFAQGTQKYCQKVCNELLSGHRKLNKSFLNEIERRAEKNRKNSLPVLEGGFRKEKLGYYKALGYRFKQEIKGLDLYTQRLDTKRCC